MTSVVLDASALTAVNYSEVLKKALERQQAIRPVAALLQGYRVEIVPFDEVLAASSAELLLETKKHGLSFADRACLALGVQRNCKVFTSEQRMVQVTLPIKVKLIRNAH